MSSTKITSHDIDDSVLDGVAMQSTSQEILEKVEGVNRSVESVGRRGEIYLCSRNTTTGTVTPLNVTGKGKLYYALIRQSVGNNQNAVVSIIADGKTVYSQSRQASSTEVNIVLLGNRDYAIGSGATSNQHVAYYFRGGAIEFNTSGSNIVDYYSGVCNSIDENSTVSLANTKNGVPHQNIDGYIQFNESLVIRMTNTYSSISQWFICYSLDEE